MIFELGISSNFGLRIVHNLPIEAFGLFISGPRNRLPCLAKLGYQSYILIIGWDFALKKHLAF
jgi:hypothetical protein